MRLIDDDGVVLAQQSVAANFGQQDTVGHQFDAGILAHAVIKTHGITDVLSNLFAQLMGDALRYGTRRNTTWLSMTNLAPHAATQFEAYLRDLRSLTRASLTSNNDDLIVFNCLCNVVAARGHRQLGRVGDARNRFTTIF